MGDIVSDICRVLGVDAISSDQGREVERLLDAECGSRLEDAMRDAREQAQLDRSIRQMRRTQMAGHALAGLLACPLTSPRPVSELAMSAVDHGDAVLAELEQRK